MGKRRRGHSLARLLLSDAILSIVLPVVAGGITAYIFLAYHLDLIESSLIHSRDELVLDIAGADVRSLAHNAVRQMDVFLFERIVEAKSWASARMVVDAAREGHDRHDDASLVGLPLDEVERRLHPRKSLGHFPEADSYVRQQVAESPYFAEVFFTDRYGFNVALSNPTSDFVQSDEDWWAEAWAHHISVGEVEYDDSAGVWSVEISVRIDEPSAAMPLGVMKTIVAIESVQFIADQVARDIPDGKVAVTTQDGFLIAETHSRHSRDRNMNPNVNLKEQGGSSLREAFGPKRRGFAADEENLVGYAQFDDRGVYGAVAKRFDGFGWRVIVQRPVSGVLDSFAALPAIESALRNWRVKLALNLGAIALASTIIAIFFATRTARRLAASLRAIREMAERTSRGEQVTPAEITRPEELVQVNDAVHHLNRVLVTIVNRIKRRPTDYS